MGFFDDYFQPQDQGGLPGWLESMQQQQAYQPDVFGGWSPPASATATPQVPATPPTYPVSRPPLPAPRPSDIPSGGLPIGDYFMPQFGTGPAAQNDQVQPDLGDRMSAGFRSWAYTPLGNPFAALANAITGFTTGRYASAPALQSSSSRLQLPMPMSEDSTVAAAPTPAFQPLRTPPSARALARRIPVPRR